MCEEMDSLGDRLMCEFDGEAASVWTEKFRKSRKEYQCYECWFPILKGVKYCQTTMLFEGEWSSYRMHADCHKLKHWINDEFCGSSLFMMGGFYEAIEEHDEDSPSVRRRFKYLMKKRARESALVKDQSLNRFIKFNGVKG